MKPRRLAILAALLVLFSTDRVFADDAPLQTLPSPHVRLPQGGELIVPEDRHYFLPLGTHIIDNLGWQDLDNEVKRLQDSETRLKAENKSLKSALSSWSPGWGSLILLTGLAIATGTVVYYVN